MQYYYGNQMPLRVLDEAEFWKHQEEEHTVVIRELVNNLEPQFLETLEEWEKPFAQTHHRVVRYIETVNRMQGQVSQSLYQDTLQLTTFCLEQSNQFIAFCRKLMDESEPIQTNQTAQVVMNHIIVESEILSESPKPSYTKSKWDTGTGALSQSKWDAKPVPMSQL